MSALVLLASEVASYSSGSSDGGAMWLLALGPAGAVGVYWALWSYYRNAGKSHDYERETAIAAQPVTGEEHVINQVHGTRRSSIDGDNSDDHRQRVRRRG